MFYSGVAENSLIVFLVTKTEGLNNGSSANYICIPTPVILTIIERTLRIIC